MITYEIWQHHNLGLYSVRVQAGQVTGAVAIDLRTAAAVDFDPAQLVHEEQESTLHRFVESPEQFYRWPECLIGVRIRPRRSRPMKWRGRSGTH